MSKGSPLSATHPAIPSPIFNLISFTLSPFSPSATSKYNSFFSSSTRRSEPTSAFISRVMASIALFLMTFWSRVELRSASTSASVANCFTDLSSVVKSLAFSSIVDIRRARAVRIVKSLFSNGSPSFLFSASITPITPFSVFKGTPNISCGAYPVFLPNSLLQRGSFTTS